MSARRLSHSRSPPLALAAGIATDTVAVSSVNTGNLIPRSTCGSKREFRFVPATVSITVKTESDSLCAILIRICAFYRLIARFSPSVDRALLRERIGQRAMPRNCAPAGASSARQSPYRPRQRFRRARVLQQATRLTGLRTSKGLRQSGPRDRGHRPGPPPDGPRHGRYESARSEVGQWRASGN